MKQRFSSLDVKVIAHELSNSLTTLRLSNAYNLSSRIFLLKFAKPDHREQLLIESGFRCHLTSFSRTTAAAPSAFVSKLRKFLKTRRVTLVQQIGTDRIIELQFSEGQYRLFLEFYAAGNVVLTDKELNVLALLRNVSEGAEHEQLKLGVKYNLELRQNYGGVPDLTKERVREALQKAIEKQKVDETNGKKTKKKKQNLMRQALAVGLSEFPPMLIDHALHVKKYDTELKPEDIVNDESQITELVDALHEAQTVIDEIKKSERAKGFILGKRKDRTTEPNENSKAEDIVESKTNVVYDDFHPFKPAQFETDPSTAFLEFEGFNKTVDEFFSSLEGQKLESRLQEREDTAKRKMDNARQEHEKRLQGLQQVQETHVRKAQAIEANLERITEATAALNGLIAQGMDWLEIDRLIEREQTRNNPVAQMIMLPLKLNENTATLLLDEYSDEPENDDGYFTDSEPSESEEEEQEQETKKPKAEDKRLAVEIDLGESAWVNARVYYDQKKVAATKEEKTAEASAKALKSTEHKINKDLKKGLKQEKEVLRPTRRQFWFEKFIYFISSDGYLVLAGKDAQQNEILFNRYLKKGDVYVHADLEGATSAFILNNSTDPTAPIPPSTLSQAGNLVVSTSSAWDSKAVMSAWWVPAEQVSKLARTGDVLPPGQYHIKSDKNFLPPAQLLLGFAVMWHISEDSKKNHQKHRLQVGNDDGNFSKDTPDSMLGTEDGDASKLADDDEGEAGDDEDDDNDFPDADPKIEDDDEFPDVDPKGVEEDDEFPDTELKSHSEDEDENEEKALAYNPLQTNGPGGASNDKEDEGRYEHHDFDETDEKGEPEASSLGKRYLSAHERRLLKKGRHPEPSTTLISDADSDTPSVSSQPTNKSLPAQISTVLPRGKRGKAKKLASKYADQDEEDRALALRLLGSKAGQEKAAAEEAARLQRQKEVEEAKQRRREQHDRAQKEGRAREEARMRKLATEGIEAEGEDGEEDGDAKRDLGVIECLVGTPHPNDELLAAIPVCAPWSALGRSKYRVKLQPGSVKKGKAVREILGGWMAQAGQKRNVDEKAEDTEKFWPKEVDLLKAWKDVEVLGVVPVRSVRVVMGAGGAGGSGGGAKGGAGGKGGKGGKGGRGGRGSKKQR